MSVQRDDGSGMSTIATTSNTSPPYTDTTVVTLQTYDYQVTVSMKVESEHTPHAVLSQIK